MHPARLRGQYGPLGEVSMRVFLETAAGSPTLLFTAALVVVVGFWILVACGAADADSFDEDVNLDAWGVGGVPVAVAFSLLTAVAWLLSLGGRLLLDPVTPSGTLGALADLAMLAAAPLIAWWATRGFVRLLLRLLPVEPGLSRTELVGLTCTIRTGRVDAGFGRAQVSDRDGSTAVVEVRQSEAGPLSNGSLGLLCAYDETGGFFWVAPFDTTGTPHDRVA